MRTSLHILGIGGISSSIRWHVGVSLLVRGSVIGIVVHRVLVIGWILLWCHGVSPLLRHMRGDLAVILLGVHSWIAIIHSLLILVRRLLRIRSRSALHLRAVLGVGWSGGLRLFVGLRHLRRNLSGFHVSGLRADCKRPRVGIQCRGTHVEGLGVGVQSQVGTASSPFLWVGFLVVVGHRVSVGMVSVFGDCLRPRLKCVAICYSIDLMINEYPIKWRRET